MDRSGRNYPWEALADGVFRCRLPFLDVTVGLVHGGDATLLIDCGTTALEAAAIAADVRALTGSAVTHLVLTHHHFDHILGCRGFPDAAIYSSPAVAEALTVGLDATIEHAVRYGAERAEFHRAAGCLRPPDHLVEQARIELGDHLVQVEHPGRGHTDHDLIVVVPAGPGVDRPVVFCGDLIEESGDPAIDAGSDLEQWPATLDRVLSLGGEGALYVPGHGAVVDAAFVRAQRDWIARRSTQPR